MTVSHRKNKPVAKTDDKSAAEPGVRYHCDACGADITLTVRVRCAGGCEDFDLCGSCFCAGTEVGRHKAWHEYRVVEQHSYPIFCADWGADEELLLIDGCQIYGLGNWADIADHIGNRTKEEVEQHYVQVYVEGRDGTPAGDARARAADEAAAREGKRPPVVGPNEGFEPDVDLEEFQRRKRRRIEDLRDMQAAYHPPKATKPLVSAPTNHSELAGFMPGRLEFEHEYEQEAEHLTKDMEFGRVYRFGGAEMPAEHEALGAVLPVQGAPRMEASRRGAPTNAPAAAAATKKTAGTGEADEGAGDETGTSDRPQADASNARSGSPPTPENDSQAAAAAPAAASAGDAEDRAPDWDEDEADLELKLAVLEMYNERLDRRARRKQFVFERNLVDLKRNQASERKRPKEERELLSRIKHFAQMQTAQDFEDFLNGLIYEDALKRTAAQLQGYRRAGITTLADAARYDREKADRARKAAALAESGPMGLAAMGVQASGSVRQRTDTWGARSRGTGRESSSGLGSPSLEGKDTVVPKAGRKPPQPLNLSSAASLHLLTPAETTLCSTLRILPQPFLLIKQTLITEYLRRSGRLTRREARGLVRIDVNKLGKVWDFFYQQGYFDAAAAAGWAGGPGAPPGPGPSLSRSGSMNDLHGPSSGGAGGASGHGGANHRLNDVAANGPNSIPRSAAASPLANGSGSTTGAAFYQAAGSPFAASGSNNGRGAPLIAQHSHSHGQNAAGTPNAGGGSMQASPLRATAAV